MKLSYRVREEPTKNTEPTRKFKMGSKSENLPMHVLAMVLAWRIG